MVGFRCCKGANAAESCVRQCEPLVRASPSAHIFCRLTLCWARTTAPVHGSRLRVCGGEFAPERRPHSGLENLPLLVHHQCLSLALFDTNISIPALIGVLMIFIFIFFEPGGLCPATRFPCPTPFFLCRRHCSRLLPRSTTSGGTLQLAG